ncbi:MAG: prepilin-type N-terminal cleavage/methylation domain-containing protein [Nitrospirales bacterium]|nr:prepilin-type N-terminal cleavage/methylation domain-containing protein [Nitrospirales bacterium]
MQIFLPMHICREGYTLTELLITLSIMGIIAVLSGTWLLEHMPTLRIRGAVRQIRSDCLAARMAAVNQGNEFRIFFRDPYRYDILDDDNNNGKPDAGEQIESRDLRIEYGDVTLNATNDPIFHPRGTASSLATITLTNSAGTKTLTVGITGRVKVRLS